MKKRKRKESNQSKITNECAKYKVYCKCGHSVIIYPCEHRVKKICSWCGHTVYKNDLEKFKDLLIKKKREVEL